jgi:outer membrane protein TolC
MRWLLTFCVMTVATPYGMAQMSFTTAVDLALRNSPKVRMAQADVDKALAGLAQAKDVYIPSLVGGSGLGYSYGFPLGQPTLFTLQSQSLGFSFSQRDYIRAARLALQAANLSLQEVREQVSEDVCQTYLTLDRTQQRKAAVDEEYGFATRLVSIVQDRLDAGQDTQMSLLQARRTVAEIRLQQLRLADELANNVDHLGRLTGLPNMPIATIPESIPAFTPPHVEPGTFADTPGVRAAALNAKARREQAFGDAKWRFRPQVGIGLQYSRFTNFNNYAQYYPGFGTNLNAAAAGVQISIPAYDRIRGDKAKESAAEATRAEQDAMNIRDQALEGRLKLQHTAAELTLHEELASIDRDIAKNQLDVMMLQLQSSSSGGVQMTPKDEQNARIQERQKYLDYLDADYQLRQTQITLLKQTGELESWIKTAAQNQVLSGPVSK